MKMKGGFLLNKLHNFLLLLLFTLFLGGCSFFSPEERIYQVLEQTVKKEEDFEKQQKPLTQIENKEKELFEQIMGLGIEEMEQIKKLADEAIEFTEEREALLTKEHEAMKASKKEFEKSEKYIKKLEDKELQKEAKALYKLMEKRFETHDELYQVYNEGIKADRKLYQLLKDKSLEYEQLEGQIKKTNKIYKNLFKVNDEFNKLTDKYNQGKIEFYKNAGMKIDESKK